VEKSNCTSGKHLNLGAGPHAAENEKALGISAEGFIR
jgi:hypothetical protein